MNYWILLKYQFIDIAQNTNDNIWDEAPHLFLNNKNIFDFNTEELKYLEKTIKILDGWHNTKESR